MLTSTHRLLAVGSLAAAVFSINGSSTANAAPSTQVELSDITTAIVPTRLTQGDRDFGGNGPDVTCRTTLEVASGGRKINAKIYFKARETKSDWSTVEESFTRTVYTAPAGQRISRIEGPRTSEVRFRSQSAGFQILGPGEDFKSFVNTLTQLVNQVLDAERTLSDRDSDTSEVRDARRYLREINSAVSGLQFAGNHVHIKHPESGPVALFGIVGDTGGDDISRDRNPKDDTRIQSISFNPVRVVFAGGSPPPAGGGSGTNTCEQSIQGRIAWDYSGNKRWGAANLDRLCGGENTTQPGQCFQRVMHGGVSWGGSTRWSWGNALNLCAGSTNANATISCFERERDRSGWSSAINSCKAD